MYNFIKGTIVEKSENFLVIENNQIGFELVVSANTLEALSPIGTSVKMHTYYYVREDQAVLFGFNSLEEKHMFLKLIKVNGVGPKLAITILSGINISDLAITIMNADTSALNKIKGVGKKTAERIVLELKEKVAGFENLPLLNSNGGNIGVVADACSALTALGISKTESLRLIKKVQKVEDTAEDLIEKALKSFNR